MLSRVEAHFRKPVISVQYLIDTPFTKKELQAIADSHNTPTTNHQNMSYEEHLKKNGIKFNKTLYTVY